MTQPLVAAGGSPSLGRFPQASRPARGHGPIHSATGEQVHDGGQSWAPVRRLYADPRVVPAHAQLRYHQFDLSSWIGQPLLLRFRYDDGVASVAPDSPGWWLDDIIISARIDLCPDRPLEGAVNRRQYACVSKGKKYNMI